MTNVLGRPHKTWSNLVSFCCWSYENVDLNLNLDLNWQTSQKLDPILFQWTFCWSSKTAENLSLNFSSILAPLKMLLIIPLITWIIWIWNRILMWFLQSLTVLLRKLLYVWKNYQLNFRTFWQLFYISTLKIFEWYGMTST